MTGLPAFTELAAARDPDLDVLALALAAEFREVDAPGAIATLDALGEELSRAASGIGDAELQARACAQLLGETHGFAGDREDYDSPENSMLDLVLVRRRGLPILLSVLYVEVARRAGITLAGVGLPGHFVVGHFGTHPPVLIDPFEGGGTLRAHVPDTGVRPWGAHETAMRMLNNLVVAYQRRGDVAAAIRAAGMRLALPSAGPHRATLEAEWRAMQARLN
ncbi:MAG TPA: transglutaminase-like domain-containing protein [Solirubrobacteraceae bacterium]|jgi:regulator of sirC expression with transglutaminase-like and TPR domain|nr:transglutaminase-like domain-containing protein [Solirubrobacteraceae bacterium]